MGTFWWRVTLTGGGLGLSEPSPAPYSCDSPTRQMLTTGVGDGLLFSHLGHEVITSTRVGEVTLHCVARARSLPSGAHVLTRFGLTRVPTGATVGHVIHHYAVATQIHSILTRFGVGQVGFQRVTLGKRLLNIRGSD